HFICNLRIAPPCLVQCFYLPPVYGLLCWGAVFPLFSGFVSVSGTGIFNTSSIVAAVTSRKLMPSMHLAAYTASPFLKRSAASLMSTCLYFA
ncbi:hypothetical protein, partial [Hominisplanchenecus faecis]|uniref:hypothetical protein n=1 Tax=Hominisplanchenecus faecis TaxID=2885351 RepID=UPI0032BFF325